jgi:hypothetical protein
MLNDGKTGEEGPLPAAPVTAGRPTGTKKAKAERNADLSVGGFNVSVNSYLRLECNIMSSFALYEFEKKLEPTFWRRRYGSLIPILKKGLSRSKTTQPTS